MTIEKLLELLPTTMQIEYEDIICECGKKTIENVFYNLQIEGSYSAPIDTKTPEIEGNRYIAYYQPKFLKYFKNEPKKIGDLHTKYRTVQEALDNLYNYLIENNLIN